VQAARRLLAAIFAGDRRVWRVAAIAAVPFVALTAFYCLRPRFYETGSDSVEDISFLARTQGGEKLCVPGLELPARTGIVRLRVLSSARERPELRMAMYVDGQALHASLAPQAVAANAISNAEFAIPQRPAKPGARGASLCVSSAGPVTWAGTPLSAPPAPAPTLGGKPVSGSVAVWYLPRAGSQESYVQQAGAIFARAALFRPGIIGAWTYPLLLLLVLPLLALLALRCLALALAGRGRRLAAWMFAIAAVNFCCWALITPVFQGPDEIDHFAYTQSLVERGEGPSHDENSPLPRWSSAEGLALEHTDFFTDHESGDSHPPWLSKPQQRYFEDVKRLKPKADNGGGYSTSAAHGPIYYLALAPAYLLTRHSSVFSQLTLMRIVSALLGALVVMFAFLLGRELAPRRQWLAVLAALLVTYEPMYGFISGIVNNDVGVNAVAAAVELLLIRMLRRGITIPWALLLGLLVIALPIVKGTGLSLYPVVGLVLVATLWRHHRRRDVIALAGLALGAIVMAELSSHVLGLLQPAASATGSGSISTNAGAASGALHHIPIYLSYVWQSLLPRLPFMTALYPPVGHGGFVLFNDPGFVIFVERGWAAFGWYNVLFPHWIYVVIFLAMVAAVPVGVWAARREWSWLRAHWIEVLALIAMPVAVILGFEAAYFSQSPRPVIAEFGRYAFPAIAPTAVLVVGALHAFGRRRMASAGVVLLVAMLALSYASQLLTLTRFYA
jgi:4-amino-4-deoxy-L-arabinose transferase-like glycosyltransferase